MEKIIIILLPLIFLSCQQKGVIAKVEGKAITLAYFQQELSKLPDSTQSEYKNDSLAFLDELIAKELLLQESKRLQIDTISEVKTTINQDKNQREDILIEQLLDQECLSNIEVTDEEITAFYNNNISDMPGMTLEQAKQDIYDILISQKEQVAIGVYIYKL
jgi:hypothetical protein